MRVGRIVVILTGRRGKRMSRKSWLMMTLSMTQTEGKGERSHWSTINFIQFTARAVE